MTSAIHAGNNEKVVKMTESEMIEKWAELSKDTMTKDAHRQMADNYDKLADHFEELAAEARRHAEAHRTLM